MEKETAKGKKESPEKRGKGESDQPTDTGSKRRRRKSSGTTGTGSEVEARTPLKRQRVPVQKFQSPAEELIPVPSTSKQKDAPELLHKKGSFLGVRGEEGSFYLCKTIQNVFENTRKFRIQWLDLDQPPDVYKLDFVDTTDADCILTNVKMERVIKDTYRLPMKEQRRVEEILHKALKKERGEPVDDIIIHMSADEDDDDDEETEDEEWEEPTPKKAKKSQPKAGKSPASAKGKSSTPKTKQTKSDKGTGKKDVKGKADRKKGPDKNLQPNPKIKTLEKDPFFETREKTDFVSKTVQGKLAIRAVQLADMKLLNSLIEDKDLVYELDDYRSIDVEKTALHYAIEKNNHEAIRTLVKDYFTENNERKKKGTAQSVLIQKSDQGRYNQMSLGRSRIRQISQSRGSREGNDAFIKDLSYALLGHEDYVEEALKLGVNKETLDVLINANPNVRDTSHLLSTAIDKLYLAVLCGNRKLAGYLVEQSIKMESTGFGFLHKDVLLYDKEDLRANIMAASVKKKPWDNKSITPLHCAAINPNVAYLTRLLTIEPNINIEDREHRRPIHFAAVCDGIAPLEFLLSRGASPLEQDNQGMIPLHYACSAGRPRNVDILLKKAKEAAGKHGDVFQSKWGPGGVDKPSRSSYCPVHIAVTYNHSDVLKILIKHQVDVNKVLSAGKNKVAPLMIAAKHGDLDVCKVLIQNGAHVEQLDKLKRSALTHAVMNGNTNVASYLLHLGADPNRCDSSGNSVVHYAAAYGWLFCLKLLQDAGAELGKANQWETTPIGIAFLKGHVGIVDFLLKQSGVDINFKNDEGLTLTSLAATSVLEPGLYDQIKYLLDRKADPAIRDANGFDALHHLASNKITKSKVYNYWDEEANKDEIDDGKMELTVKIAKLLLESGCDPTAETEDGCTALMFAIEQLNIKLVELLVDHGGTVTSHKSEDGKTILHMMADLCMESDLSSILKILVERKPKVKRKSKAAIKEPKEEKQDKMVVENGDNGEETGSKPEAMDVDEETGDKKGKTGDGDKKESKPKQNGSGESDDVNGMEVDNHPAPGLKKMASIASQEDIWPVMATELDNNGYTPLLWACKVYRDFKKKGKKVTDEEVIQCSQSGRNFISSLIELVDSDVSATVREKTFPEEDVPRTEAERFGKDGKCSALHLLLRVGHEIQEHLNCAGLEMLCKHKPNTEHRNLAGKTALVLAVEDKSKKALDLLIKVGANVNMTYGSEATGFFTPLHKAAEDGQVSLVQALIAAGADTKASNTKTGDQPLHLAVHFRGDDAHVIEVVRQLLNSGADVNAGKFTPLHSAVLANTGKSNASTELEEFLIARGANVFARDEKQRLPLHYAFVSQSNPRSVSQVDPIELCSVLTDSMANKELDGQDEQGRSPLHMAACRGATICCVHLLQRGVQILTGDKVGHTALSLAVKNAHDSCAIVLLQKGAKVDKNIVIPPAEPKESRMYYTKPGSKQKLPIWMWIPAGSTEPVIPETVFDIYETAIARELQGVAHMVLDSTGLTGKAIEAALRVNKYHIALRHLHRIKDNSLVTNYVNAEEQNLLHILALVTESSGNEALQLKVAKVLVEKGVSLKKLDKFKRLPIVYVALKYQPLQLAQFYLEKGQGIDMNKEDVYGRNVMTALFWDQEKMQKGNKKASLDYVKLFLDAKASTDVFFTVSCPSSPLFDITVAGCPLDYFKPLEVSSQMTPLISSMYNEDRDLVRFLLKNGANVNLADKNGVTPLMHAVKINDPLLVRILLNYDYVKKTETGEEKTILKKKLSRNAFAVTAGPTDDDDDKDDDKDDDEDDKDDDEDDKDDDDDNGDDGTDNFEEQDDNDDGEDDAENSDHDTDVVDDDDDDEDEDSGAQHLPLPRLGSKQPSLRKIPTSLVKEEEFEVVEKTSPVNLDVKDKNGWTVVHHLVSPLEYGTFDNEEILYVLNKVGVSLTTESNKGETPLKMALQIGAVKLAQRLQTILVEDSDKREKPSFSSFNTEAENNVSSEARTFDTDAESMVKKLLPKDGESKTKIKPTVDKKCMVASTGEVVYDTAQDLPYDVILSKIEVRSMLSDSYNFYKMQIVYHKAKGIYILFTKWGRIGDTGMYQQTPYQKLSEAVINFCKIFKSKTGNQWLNVKTFTRQPKKYSLVETESQPQPVLRVDFKLESSIPAKLPEQVQLLLTEIADVGMMHAAMSNAKMAEEYMPFGRIKREKLIDARKTLQTIGEIVVEMDKKRANLIYDNAEHQSNCEKIAKLSTEYYSLIPVEGYAFDRIEPLSNKSLISTHMRLISNLLDLETASKLLLGAQYRINEMSPLDYIYRELGCTITPLREEDVNSQYILKYMQSSTKTPKVLCIYKLCRPGEDQREKFKSLSNHKLLWHGTKMSNMMGILHNGLLVAPAEAPITGHAFGEGIYTADTFKKSEGYCQNYNPKSDIQCALLCEVALGNCKEDARLNDDLDMIHSEYNSLKILGRSVPDEDWDLSLPYGACMPMGCVETKDKWMSPEGEVRRYAPHNEYIVQDSDQIALRYLVQFI